MTPLVRNRGTITVALAAIASLLIGLGLVAGTERADASKRTVDCGETSTGGLGLSTGKCFVFKKARLVNGKAIPPASAPPRVKAVIEAANRIRNKPYRYGGGHGSFEDTGYDCSGSVSYALRGGRFLSSPLPSSGFYGWGKSGVGKWITIYTNPGHMYMVVAGLRFDTSMTPGDGPGWSTSMRSTSGTFMARSPVGY
jgi:hypothetical protein